MQLRHCARLRAVNIWFMGPVLGLAVFLAVFVSWLSPVATAATSSNLNFQARLFGINGTVVADGTYNIDFKLYNADSTTGTVGTCTGACLWEETRTGSNRVNIINGFFSVNLGSVTAFPSINWDQPLWLTMNIGGTGASPVWDGEMQNGGHSIALTAIPYAFVAAQLAKTDGSGNRGTIGFNTVANNPNILLPDASGTVCLQGSGGANGCGYEGTAGNDFIQNQIATTQTANFAISGTGIIGTSLQTGLVQTADSSTGSTGALTLRSGNQTGSSLSSGSVTIKSGDASGGTNSSSGNIVIDSGAKSGSGTSGTISIGASNASGVTIGNTTTTATASIEGATITLGNSTTAHTISIGHGGTSTQTINIGSTSSASALNIQSGSGGVGVSGNLNVTNSTALQKGTDFPTTGTTTNASLANASLIRLTGASAQTIDGIANGRDGYLLTLVNAASQAATIVDTSDSTATATNQVITGTGADYSLPAGNSIQLVYDAGVNRWRIVGISTPGVTTVGTYSNANHYANGAQISGNTITLGGANATNPGLVDTGNQTFAGNKTFSGTISVAPTTNISSVVIKQTSAASPNQDIFDVQGTNGTSEFIQITSSAANQGAVSIQSFGSNNITLQAGSGTVSLGTSTTLNASGALTLASGTSSDLTLNSLSGILKFGTNTTGLLFTDTATATLDAASGSELDIGTAANAHTTKLGSATGASSTTIQSGSGGVTLAGSTTVNGTNAFTVSNGATSLTDSSGTALTVNNSTGANSIVDFQDNGSSVFLVGDGGATTISPNQNVASLVVKQTSAASPTADILDVQNSGGTQNFLSLNLSSSTPHLHVYDSSGSNYADIYYSGGQAVFAANSGTTALGGTGNVVVQTGSASSFTITGDAASSISTNAGAGKDLTLDSGSGTLKFGTNTTTLQKAASALTLDVSNGASNSTLTISNSGGAGNITLALDSGGTFAVGASTGTTASACSAGTVLTGTLVGGIVTSGSCVGAASTLQDAYNNSSSPATITTSSSSKGILFKAGSSNDSTSLFAVQNASSSNLFSIDSSDGYVINNGITNLDNILQNPGFEASGTTDATGWFTPSASQVITVSSANAHSGNNELQISGNSSTHAVTSKYYAVQPGDQIYAEAWVKNSAGATGDAGIYVEFSDANKGNAVFANADTGLPGTSYVLKSITATVPAGKDYVRLAASVKATATTGTFYFDDFYLKRINQQAPLLLTAATSTAFQVQNSSSQTVLGVDASANKLFSGLPDGASAVGFTLNTTNAYSTSGAKLISVQNNGSEKFYIDKDGNVNASGGVTAGGDLTTTGNANIGSGKNYEVNGTQISSSALSNNSDLAKLSGTGPQVFSGNNKFTGTVLVANANAAGLQVQNATTNVMTVDTSGNKTILGTAGGSGLTANLQFNYNGSTGSISFVPLDPSSTNYTLNLPAENGTLCTSAASSTSNCTNFASASSVTSGLNGKLNKNSVDTSATTVTALQGDLYSFTNNSSNVASGVLNLNNGSNTGNALYVTGTNDYSSGSAYIVVNNTNAGPAGNLIDLQSNAADEFTVDASGNVFANGNINVASGKLYEINGSQISTSALSDGAQVAKLGATQTFSGANTFSNVSNSFTGDGSNLTNLNASNIASGTLNDGRLSSNVALLNRSGQTFSGDNTFAPTSNGVGTTIRQTSGTATTGSVLDVQTADGTGHFFQITNAAANQGAVTLQSVGGSNALTLGSASGTIVVAASAGTIQHSNSSLTIDVNSGSDSTFIVTNSQGGAVASLSVEGDIAAGAGRVYKVGTTSGVGITCGSNTYLQNATTIGGITSGGNCANAVNSISTAGGSIANGASISGNALTLGFADTSNPGLVSNTTQSFNGAKTFVNDLTVKESSSTALQIQNSSGSSGVMLNVDTTNGGNINLLGNNSGELSSWTSVTGLAASDEANVSTIINGYLYSIGGISGSNDVKTVRYVKVNANGSVPTSASWSANSVSLPGTAGVSGAGGDEPGIATYNGYIYLAGGSWSSGSSGATNTVYYGKVNNDGSISAWTLSSNTLCNGGVTGNDKRWDPATAVVNGYLYVAGGFSAASADIPSTCYAKINPDGTLSAFSAISSSGIGPTSSGLSFASATAANGYIYVVGGLFAGTPRTGIYYAKPTSTGDITAWNTASNSLPAARSTVGAFVANGYLYAISGGNSGAKNSIYYAPIGSTGDLGSWTTSSNNSTLSGRTDFGYAQANGYFYIVGGDSSTGGAPTATVQYASTARIQLTGAIDLVSLSGETLNSGNDTTSASNLTAGNVNVTGALNVQGNSQLWGNISINGDFAVSGAAVFKDATNSTTAFQVQNSAGASVLVVDTSNRQLRVMENAGSTNYSLIYYDTATNTANYTASAGTVAVGRGAGAITITSGTGAAVNITANAASSWQTTAGTLTLQSGSGTSDYLILNANGSGQVQVNGSAVVKLGISAGDPATCTTGAIVYNSTTNLFRGCQNGSWATLSSSTQTLQQAYTASTGSTTPEIKVDSTRSGVDIQDADSTIGGVLFAVRGSNAGGLGTSLFNVSSANNTVNIGTSATSTALLVLGIDTDATFNQGTISSAATEVNGAMFYSSTDHNFLCGTAGQWITCNGLLYSNTAASSAVNTCTTACAAFSTNNSTMIPANYCQAGRVITIRARGHYSVASATTPTLQMGVYYGTNSTTAGSDTQIGASTPAPASASGATNQFWALDYTITCFDTTHMLGEGTYTFQNSATNTTNMLVLNVLSTASTSVTTNSAKSLYIFPTWSASNASNSATLDQLIVTGN